MGGRTLQSCAPAHARHLLKAQQVPCVLADVLRHDAEGVHVQVLKAAVAAQDGQRVLEARVHNHGLLAHDGVLLLGRSWHCCYLARAAPSGASPCGRLLSLRC